ncbi:MAG: hypothetical protein RL044_327, partial [Actinomycetota bacterium]
SSKPGDLVLDFFAGSGTTAFVAADLGRSFIAIDKSDESIAVIQERLGQAGVKYQLVQEN